MKSHIYARNEDANTMVSDTIKNYGRTRQDSEYVLLHILRVEALKLKEEPPIHGCERPTHATFSHHNDQM